METDNIPYKVLHQSMQEEYSRPLWNSPFSCFWLQILHHSPWAICTSRTLTSSSPSCNTKMSGKPQATALDTQMILKVIQLFFWITSVDWLSTGGNDLVICMEIHSCIRVCKKSYSQQESSHHLQKCPLYLRWACWAGLSSGTRNTELTGILDYDLTKSLGRQI